MNRKLWGFEQMLTFGVSHIQWSYMVVNYITTLERTVKERVLFM